eukprot:COSAG01_NODE_2631_length_7340_cov_35.191686_5_plen_351_part_00
MGGALSVGRGAVRWAGRCQLGGALSVGRGAVSWAGRCQLGGALSVGLSLVPGVRCARTSPAGGRVTCRPTPGGARGSSRLPSSRSCRHPPPTPRQPPPKPHQPPRWPSPPPPPPPPPPPLRRFLRRLLRRCPHRSRRPERRRRPWPWLIPWWWRLRPPANRPAWPSSTPRHHRPPCAACLCLCTGLQSGPHGTVAGVVRALTETAGCRGRAQVSPAAAITVSVVESIIPTELTVDADTVAELSPSPSPSPVTAPADEPSRGAQGGSGKGSGTITQGVGSPRSTTHIIMTRPEDDMNSNVAESQPLPWAQVLPARAACWPRSTTLRHRPVRTGPRRWGSPPPRTKVSQAAA